MESLSGKPVVVLSSAGKPISMGHFELVQDAILTHEVRLELVFQTPTLSCRMRIPAPKIPAIKETWDGTMFHYSLPAGENVWGSIG